jgi:tRNA threonylcarbamoyladenosine modification (KEOPS) complex Cgi121 subunit
LVAELLRYWADSEDKRLDEQIGFLRAYKFVQVKNLKDTASKLTEGIALCSPKLLGGKDHAKLVLIQALEYWKRNQSLARNRSLDLLMRISCTSQIESAIDMSSLDVAKKVAVIGLAENAEIIEEVERALKDMGGLRDDRLFALGKSKELFLRKIHKIPDIVKSDHVADWLAEKSILLALER